MISSAIKETNIPDIGNPALSVKAELLSIVLDEARKVQDKVLVFSQSLTTLDYLANLLQMQHRRVCRLDGSTAIPKRQDMIKNFNEGDQEVYLISTNAGGVGLNIQGANRVVIFDFKWNPVHDQQAVGRAYRIGQEKTVFVYRFVVAGTFEEDLQNKAVFKMQLASRVVDKKNPVSWSKRLGSVLHHIRPAPAKSLTEFVGKDRILDKLIGYKDRAVIRSIVSTDTFEEEDGTEELTAEERQHAEDMVKMNRLRLTDPAEYERQREEEAQRLLTERVSSIPQTDLAPSTTAGAAALAQATPTALPGTSRFRVVHQQNMNRPGSLPFQSGSGGLPSTAAQNQFPQRYPQQQVGTGRGGAQVSGRAGPPLAPRPIAGANTYFGSVTQQPGPAPANDGPTAQPAPSTSARVLSTRGPLFTASPRARDAFRSALRSKLESLASAGHACTAGPQEATARRVTTLIENNLERMGNGFILNDQHWNMLKEYLAHDRFALAAASGHLAPSYLARIARQELERRMEVLRGLSEEGFREQCMAPGTKLPDPVV
ncbi:hypothetical protein CDD83_5261 [Cordyceps sp. RAO-2017]|nr:hypothetical protein CDD83_5261 [Cordyceps sp. RAO-2017]